MDLKTVHLGIKAHKRKKRVGRGPGSKRGRTATRGNKGQYARSGDQPRLLKEGGQMQLFRRVPKRGFNNQWRLVIAPVNVGDLESFPAGSTVTPDLLAEGGLAKHTHDRIKILGEGELTVKLEVHAHAFSASAKEKIEKVGGSCVVVEPPHVGPKKKSKMRPRAPKHQVG